MMTKQSTYECLECHRTRKEAAGEHVVCQNCGQKMVEDQGHYNEVCESPQVCVCQISSKSTGTYSRET